MGSSFMRLGKTFVREGFEQISKQLTKEQPNVAGKIIGGFDNATKNLLSKEIADYPPSAEMYKDILRNHPEDLPVWLKELKGQKVNQQTANGIQEIANKANKPEVAAKAELAEETLIKNQRHRADVEWYSPGGGQDLELQKILKIRRGKFQGEYTIEQLQELHANAKSSGDKTFLKGKLDEYESMLATGPAKDVDDIIVYKGDLPEAKTAQLAGTEGYKAQYDKSLEFHHKSMKRLEGVFWRKAREFLAQKKATVDDLGALHRQGQDMGVESGSRRGAAVFMHRPVHNEYLHKAKMIPGGIEPRTHKDLGGGKLRRTKKGKISGFNKILNEEAIDKISAIDVKYKEDIEWIMNWAEAVGIDEAIKKWKKMGGITPTGFSEMDDWVKLIEDVDNFEDLMALRKDMLETISVPMTKEAELLEQTIENWDPKAIQGLRNDPDAVGTITKARDTQELSNFDRRELKRQKAIRQGVIAPEPLPDPEYSGT